MRSAHPTEVKVGALEPRRNCTVSGHPPETLPEPAAAHRLETSTDSRAQRARIISMLRIADRTTQDFRRAGIFQSPTRIFELRAAGFHIPTIGRVTIVDPDGFPHRGVAMYRLISEPAPEVTS